MAIVFAAPHLRINTWRCSWPAQELRRRGFNAYVLGPDEGITETRNWAHEDTVIVHITNHAMAYRGGYIGKTVRTLKRLGCKVWVQSDDAYPHLKSYQPVGDWYSELLADIAEGLRHADGLIASTQLVAESYARWTNGPTYVIRNWIPEWVTTLDLGTGSTIPHRIDPPLVGWFGFLAGHRQEFDWLGEHIHDLDGRFGVVGSHEEVEELTGMTLSYTGDATLDPETLYRSIGAFSAGIAPLVDHPFNRARSWIKPLEFAALGIPCVAPWMPPYAELWKESDGLIPCRRADYPEHMTAHALNLLGLQDEAFSDRLRAMVRERFTIEGRGGEEWEKWARDVGAS